jgi:hypothetical protein
VLLLNECLFLLAYISLSTQSGNFWIHPRNVGIGRVERVAGISQVAGTANGQEPLTVG